MPDGVNLTRDEARAIADEAATRAVSTVFLHLGYDIRETEQLLTLRQDMEHIRSWRKASETIGKQSLSAAITIIIAGALGALWLGFQTLSGGGGN